MLHELKDVWCWQKARDLSLFIYDKTEKMEDSFLRNELRTASLLAMSNVMKGTAFSEEPDFSRCYEISISSCFRIENITYLLEDLKFLKPKVIAQLRKDVVETRIEIIAFYEFRAGRQIFKSDDDDEYLPPIKGDDFP